MHRRPLMRLNSCVRIFCWAIRNPKSREGLLRRDRVIVVVDDVLTTEHDRSTSTCGVARAAADAGKLTVGGVIEATADAGKGIAGGVSVAAADTGVWAAGGVLKSATDTGPGTEPSDILAAAADTGELAAGAVLDASADAGEETAGGVIESATNACPETFDCIPLTYDETAESGLGEPIAAPDHQVV